MDEIYDVIYGASSNSSESPSIDNASTSSGTGAGETLLAIAEKEEAKAKDGTKKWQFWQRKSMYVSLFDEMVDTVLEKESFLFDERELQCLKRLRELKYASKYVLVKLALRKEEKWQRFTKLQFERELGNVDQIHQAVEALCIPFNSQDSPQLDLNPATCPTPIPEETIRAVEHDVIDLTFDEGEYVGLIATPSSTTVEDLEALSQFCEDHRQMGIKDLLDCLRVEELKILAQKLKLKCNAQDKSNLIAVLIRSGGSQSTLSASHSRWQLQKQDSRLKEMIMEVLGKCIRVTSSVFALLRRLNLLYFRLTQHSPSILTDAILSRARKRNYEGYAYARTSQIWPSRKDLLDYEDALRLESRVSELLETSRSLQPPTRAPSKTPAKYRTPSAPAGADKENKADTAEEQGEKSGEVVEENPRVARAREVQKIFFELYPKWQELVLAKGGEQPRSGGLERFESGHVLTRIVCKCAGALGMLKEYDLEFEVLEALLAQRRWRRARRGMWYDRRALILMTHRPDKGRALWNMARDGIVEALEDEDTHTIYRPKLVRRLSTLEKRLKLPPEQCHISECELRKSQETWVMCTRLWDADDAIKGLNAPAKNTLTQWKTPGSIQALAKPTPEKKPSKKPPKWTGKSVWRGKDGEGVDVEIVALEYYERKGFKGFHCEGRAISMIFGLLFWDIIFSPVSGAFETPYQAAPLDIVEETFFHAREEAISKRLREIERGAARQILEECDDRNRPQKKWCIGVKWDRFEKQDLMEIVDCIGGKPLSSICRRFCEDYAKSSSGVPDLCVWSFAQEKCKFVEVKGPGDTLMENQKLWIDILLRSGAHVELCHVGEPGEQSTKGKASIKSTKGKKTVEHQGTTAVETSSGPLRGIKRPSDGDTLPTFTESSVPTSACRTHSSASSSIRGSTATSKKPRLDR